MTFHGVFQVASSVYMSTRMSFCSGCPAGIHVSAAASELTCNDISFLAACVSARRQACSFDCVRLMLVRLCVFDARVIRRIVPPPRRCLSAQCHDFLFLDDTSIVIQDD